MSVAAENYLGITGDGQKYQLNQTHAHGVLSPRTPARRPEFRIKEV